MHVTKAQIKNTLPNKHVDPNVAAALLNRYLDESESCDELGINILINEHHSTAPCMSSSCTLPLAALARATIEVRFMSPGIPIANRAEPVRIAEERSKVGTTLPLIIELLQAVSWFGVFGPAGLPIAAGALVVSDSIELKVGPLADLAVSLYLPGVIPPSFQIIGG